MENVMKWLKANAFVLILLLTPFVISAMVWNQMPDEMPVHWNARGEVDRYGAKWEGLLLLPFTTLGISLIFWLIPVMEPKKESLNSVKKVMGPLHLVFAGFMFGLYLLSLRASGNPSFDITRWMLPMMLVVFAVIGNYFGKLRPNYFVGIRTPWTLQNEEVWRRTHRMAGKIWVFGPVLLMPLVFLLKTEVFFMVFLPVLLVMAFWPIGYSYWLFRKLS